MSNTALPHTGFWRDRRKSNILNIIDGQVSRYLQPFINEVKQATTDEELSRAIKKHRAYLHQLISADLQFNGIPRSKKVTVRVMSGKTMLAELDFGMDAE